MAKGEYRAVAQEIALDKAERAFRALGRPVMVEDTGVYVSAMGGLPGPLIASWDGKWDLLARLVNGEGRAVAITSIAYCDERGAAQVRSGVIEGSLAPTPRGSHGFGWDPIFIPGGQSETFAEMSVEQKTAFSMRRMACDEIVGKPFKERVRLTVGDISCAPAIGDSVDAARLVGDDFRRYMKTPTGEDQIAAAREATSEWLERVMREIYGTASSSKHAGQQRVHSHELLPANHPALKLGIPLFYMQPELFKELGAERIIDLIALNHPFRLEHQIALQRAGFTSPHIPEVPVFEDALRSKRAVTFEEFGGHPSGPRADGFGVESTTEIFGAGLWSWTSRKAVTSFTNLGSMPSTVGAWSMATAALLGQLSFAPVDSVWKSTAAQKEMIARALQLIVREPFLQLSPYREHVLSNHRTVRDFLIERAINSLGVTLKPDMSHAVTRAMEFISMGIRNFRVYDPGSTSRLEQTIALLRRELGDEICIFAGQAVARDQAERLYQAGADSLVVGIGDGEMCSTSTRADVAAANPLVIYEIARAGIPIPVLADGGVGNKYTVLIGAGGAGQLTSKGLAGGTIEQPPFGWLGMRDGTWCKPYDGEAGSNTKLMGGAVDYLGRPWNLEGENGFTAFNRESPTMVQRSFERMQGLGKGLRFQGASSVTELLHRAEPADIWIMSEAARRAAAPHHVHVRHSVTS
jgi:XTP/dITP diphosphohydrolase